MIKIINIDEIIEKSNLEQLFNVDLTKQQWVWINRDVFIDIVYNVLEYDAVKEDDIEQKMNTVSEKIIIKILTSKFKEIGWIPVNQILFGSLVEDFIVTKDIETFIYSNKKFYTKKIIEKTNELNWIFKAMAVDCYQYLDIEDKPLVEIFEEYFNENGMIIEELLLTGEYKFNIATWRLDKKSNLLEFYKMDERYRQWAEGNTNFMFNELSK